MTISSTLSYGGGVQTARVPGIESYGYQQPFIMATHKDSCILHTCMEHMGQNISYPQVNSLPKLLTKESLFKFIINLTSDLLINNKAYTTLIQANAIYRLYNTLLGHQIVQFGGSISFVCCLSSSSKYQI